MTSCAPPACATKIGERRFFSNADEALEAIYSRPEHADEDDPLRPPPRLAKMSVTPLHD